MKKARVALITHDFSQGGGTTTMTRFLYRALAGSKEFAPEIVSLATSANDAASVVLRRPASWVRGTKAVDRELGGLPYKHVGAVFPEIETQRYKPRETLREVLGSFQILQFVVGIPCWACTAGDQLSDCFVWFATTARSDRQSRVDAARHVRYLNYQLMMAGAEACERRALIGARAVTALSDYSFNQVRHFTSAERLNMIPCGVDTQIFRPEKHVEPGPILCVGRQSDPRKNVRLLVTAYMDAFSLDSRLPDLALVGEPPLGSVLKWIEKSPVAHKVKILGLKRGEELAGIYRRASMLVVPSDEEGLGIVILEAMASGIPVISTRCGGPETAIIDSETGYLVPKGDAGALRDAILKLSADTTLRTRLGEAALTRAREVFSVENVGRQFIELYQQGVRN